MHDYRNLIHGTWVASASTDGIRLVNPATEEGLGVLPAGSDADVQDAVESGLSALPGWSASALPERLDMLEGVAAAVEAHAEELAALECAEMGKPVSVALAFITGSVAEFRAGIEMARTYPFIHEAVRDGDGRSLEVRHPLGVVALIVPWNFTVASVLLSLAPLLACGNTVVLKPSEKAPLSAVRLLEVLDLPPGVLNLVLGDGRAGAALSGHPDIALTHFTGSVATGRSVAVANAGRLRRSVLELGGKDPVLIDDDVDPIDTAREVALGAFTNTGQICTSMERIYVHRDIAAAFTDALVAEAERYAYGDGHDLDVRMGPLVDETQRQTVVTHVDDAVARGARIRTGGTVPPGPGFFYPATVLTGVTDDMLIMNEETFGPVAPVQVVDSFEEALAKAASTRYGLAATVYSNNPEHVEAAYHLPAGIVWINQWQAGGPSCAFEPAGQSGLGITGGTASFDAATRPTRVVRTSAVPRPALRLERS